MRAFKAKGGILGLALLAALAAGAHAQDRDVALRAEFPADLESVPPVPGFPGVPDPLYSPRVPDKEVALAILEEARWVFAGMVWGFSYRYTPSDKARAIAELFQAEPRGELPLGYPGVHFPSVRQEGFTVYATVEWVLSPADRSEYGAWAGAPYASGQGQGSARAYLPGRGGEDTGLGQVVARREAILDAARSAVREYLRGITHNKPREATGSFAFAGPPRVILREGNWIATVRLRISVDDITSYGSY